VIPYAEEKKVNLVLEHLNSRDDTHPMKGHPGYYGDDVDHCIELIKQGRLAADEAAVRHLPRADHERRRDPADSASTRTYIGHYHTAGVPGRGELDDTQEVNYPPIMRAIVATGYKGFVAHEFIPTWPDELGALATCGAFLRRVTSRGEAANHSPLLRLNNDDQQDHQ
jgi:hydroxypyruvate isomerase